MGGRGGVVGSASTLSGAYLGRGPSEIFPGEFYSTVFIPWGISISAMPFSCRNVVAPKGT